MGLLDLYEEMLKEASNTEKTTETSEEEKVAELDEETQILYKYAEAADAHLAEEYGEDYTEDDVVKLAEAMIQHDVDQQDKMEKVAESHELGQIMARSFNDELIRLNTNEE